VADLYTKNGKPLRVSGDDIFDRDGRHVGRRSGDEVYAADGRYAGTVVGDTVVYRSQESGSMHGAVGPRVLAPFAAPNRAPRAIQGDEPFE
jgi:4-fold beta flower protein